MFILALRDAFFRVDKYTLILKNWINALRKRMQLVTTHQTISNIATLIS